MTYSRFTPALLLTLCCLSFMGCDNKTPTTTTDTTPNAMSLSLDWKPEPEFGGFYAAADTGLFKQQGLSVNVNTAGPGADTWQLVATGKADFATTAADQVLVARSQGADVVAVFAVFQTSPQGVMVHKARGFNFLSDVFTHPGTLEAEDSPWLQFCRKKFGAEVKIAGYAGGIATFLSQPNDSQQCFIASEPLIAKSKGSDPQTFLVAHAGYNPYTTVVITSGKLIRSQPEVVKKMVVACRQGWQAYLTDPKATNDAMGKLNPEMEAAAFTAGADAQKELIDTPETKKAGLGSMTLERWDTLEKQLLDLKTISKAVPAKDCFINPGE